MDKFDDNILLSIFKQLNLNERAVLKLVSKKFNRLINSIDILKLVIFDSLPPIPGVFEYKNEKYGLEDTAQVHNLTSFFKNKSFIKQMRPLEMLVIKGVTQTSSLLKTEFEMNNKFENLNYLAIHHILIKNCKLLESTKLECLILDECGLRSKKETKQKLKALQGRSGNNESLSFYLYGLDRLKSLNIKYLKVTFESDYCFFLNLAEKNLLNSIQEMNVVLTDFDLSFEFIIENFPTLKKLNCLIGTKMKDFLKRKAEVHLQSLANKIRDDLKVYIAGIPFDKSKNLDTLDKFLKYFSYAIKIEDAKIEFMFIVIARDTFKKMEASDYDLTEFYKKVERFQVYDVRFLYKNLFRKFINVKYLELNMIDLFLPPYFHEYFGLFPNLEELNIICRKFLLKYGNEVLDKIPDLCNQIEKLSFEVWNDEIDFGFLFKLKRLRMLVFYVHSPIEQEVLLNLFRELKHIQMIEISFLKPANLTKEQLSTIKKRVINCLDVELKRTDYFFKIQIHTSKKEETFIRYQFKSGSFKIEHDPRELEFNYDKQKMFNYFSKQAIKEKKED